MNRVARFLGRHGWRSGWRRRIYDLLAERHPWYDWGHRLMILVGQDNCGNWSEPEPPTWWYRPGAPKHMWRTNYPCHPLSTYEVITDYGTFKERTDGLNKDEMYEWQALAVDQDGQLILGHRYWGENFYGMSKADVALLRRYLRSWRRLDWWGLRSWLYLLGLHASVHVRKPGSCQAIPPKGQGGYDHWHCQERRGHDGWHRFNSYIWGDVDGEPIGVHHLSTDYLKQQEKQC